MADETNRRVPGARLDEGNDWGKDIPEASGFIPSMLKVIHLTSFPELEPQWHKIRIKMAEMVHFIRQMQAYCHLDVIERSWIEFIDFLNKKEGDLDAMIEAHRAYLDRMVKKILLLSTKAGKEVRNNKSI